jgi:hypothetical protein
MIAGLGDQYFATGSANLLPAFSSSTLPLCITTV